MSVFGPFFVVNDSGYMALGCLESFGKHRLWIAASIIQLTNFINFSLFEFYIVRPFTNNSSLCNRIPKVIGVGSQEKMIGPNARRIITMMADEIGRLFAVINSVCYSMGQIFLALIRQCSISLIHSGSRPKPTTRRFLNAPVKSFLQGFILDGFNTSLPQPVKNCRNIHIIFLGKLRGIALVMFNYISNPIIRKFSFHKFTYTTFPKLIKEHV